MRDIASWFPSSFTSALSGMHGIVAISSHHPNPFFAPHALSSIAPPALGGKEARKEKNTQPIDGSSIEYTHARARARARAQVRLPLFTLPRTKHPPQPPTHTTYPAPLGRRLGRRHLRLVAGIALSPYPSFPSFSPPSLPLLPYPSFPSFFPFPPFSPCSLRRL